MKADAKFNTPVQERLVLNAYKNSESLKLRDEDEGKGYNFIILRPVHKNIYMRAANDLARLHICAVLSEPSLIVLKR